MIKGQHNPRAEILRDEMPYVTAVPGDLADLPSLVKAFEVAQPDEVYNLGAISFVAMSFNQPELTAEHHRPRRAAHARGDADGRRRRQQPDPLLPGVVVGDVRQGPRHARRTRTRRSTRGRRTAAPRCSGTTSSLNYRESYGLFACSGILFNHEGPRRGLEFVTRKITNAVARIKLGLQSELVLGTLESKRDWGYAGDFVRAMWSMLQQDEPRDFVVATGETHSVGEFVERAFAEVGIDDWQRYVRHDERFLRPAEVDLLIGDASRARETLGWAPTVTFDELVTMMVAHDLQQEAVKAGLAVPAL